MESAQPHAQVRRLIRISLTTQNARQLSKFYQDILGFHWLGIERRSGKEFERAMGVEGGASVITLGLGGEIVELLQFDQPGQLYPKNISSSDLCFQHFAIVVANMHLAYQGLVSAGQWAAISLDGPQKLPVSSGGVTAFKFRDPDGHPLELLAFADDQAPAHWQARSRGALFLGIDHSAIGVSNTAASIKFFESLGLRVRARSFNSGPEQDRLDAVSRAQVEVTALKAEKDTPHVELLCYRSPIRGERFVVRGNDVAATRLVFDEDESSTGNTSWHGLIDPDGHRLVIATPTDFVSPTSTPRKCRVVRLMI